MIHFVWHTSDDENLPEDPETELEFIEVPEEEAVLLMPQTDTKTKDANDIIQSVKSDILSDKLSPFLSKNYSTSEYRYYIIPWWNKNFLHIYVYSKEKPHSTYQNFLHNMETLRKVENIMGDTSNKIIVGLFL